MDKDVHAQPTEAIASEERDIVTFHDAKGLIEKSIELARELPDSYLSLVNDTHEHSIKSFLQRPIRLSTFSWTTSATAATSLYTASLPADLIATPVIKEKLAGFLGLRANVKVRVQVNAQRFQQGRLILCYFPMETQFAVIQPGRADNTFSKLVGVTQLPHVDLDISSDTEMTLEIPFTMPVSFYDLHQGTPDFGKFNLIVYSPLISPTGTPTVDTTVWAYLDDITLFWPSATTGDLFAAPHSVTLGKRKKLPMTPPEGEIRASSPGPVERVTNVIGKSLGTMPAIPILSDFVAPLTWVNNIVNGVASVFGWSKPTYDKGATFTSLVTASRMANADTHDMSQKMSLLVGNSVGVLPGFAGTDKDELDIRSIACRRAYLDNASWSTSLAVGAVVYGTSIQPQLFGTNVSDTLFYPTPAAYCASMFAYWRGSVDFVFKFVKTDFHSGRLMFVFNPGGSVADWARTNYCYREIIDLRESSEFTVRVPFANYRPYLSANESTGSAILYVLNPLVATGTVSNKIQLIVEVGFGPDIEFAVPYFRGGIKLSQPPPPSFAEPHVGDLSNTTDHDLLAIDGSSPMQQVESSSFCIGEKVTNFRQLIKRFARYGLDHTVVADTFSILNTNVIYGDGASCDYLSLVGSMFAYWRGSTRAKCILPPSIGNSRIRLWVDTVSNLWSTVPYTPGNNSVTTSDVLQLIPISGVIEVEVPQYTKCHAYVPWGISVDSSTSPYTSPNSLFIDVPTGTLITTYRAAGDDFDCGMFIGCPMLQFVA